MPIPNSQARVFIRDGFCCRYCGRKLFFGPAIKLIDLVDPTLDLYDLHGKKEPLRLSWCQVDHLLPISRGGTDCLENLVAACVACNSHHGGSEKLMPSQNKESGWHGLADHFLALAPQYPESLKSWDRAWIRALNYAGLNPATDDLGPIIEHLHRWKIGEIMSF